MDDTIKDCRSCGNEKEPDGGCDVIDTCDDDNSEWIPKPPCPPLKRVVAEDIKPLKTKPSIDPFKWKDVDYGAKIPTDPKYRKLIVYAVCIIVCAGCGYTMPIEHYKIFLEAFTIITCGFFVGNAAGKFGKVK